MSIFLSNLLDKIHIISDIVHLAEEKTVYLDKMTKCKDSFHKEMFEYESKYNSICGKMNKFQKTIAFLFMSVYNYPKMKS